MRLSVIVPTCNEREELTACLDALTAEASAVETIVVNGPSTDGTSGMVQDRDDVDLLLECSTRNINVARNAGLRAASGAVVVLLAPVYRVKEGWQAAITENLAGAADVATGPVTENGSKDPHGEHPGAVTSGQIRIVGGNLALRREAVTALDGFDEYLMTEGATDLGQRLRGQSLKVIWHPGMRVERTRSPNGGKGHKHRGGYGSIWEEGGDVDWGRVYRSMAYRAVKNDGLHPRVFGQILSAALRDGTRAGLGVLRGQGTPSRWVGNGVDVFKNVWRGGKDGLQARRSDTTAARNPHGMSRSDDDVIANRYDWR